MRHLLPEYWGNFKKDGKLFEELSKVLIEYEYNQRDFYIVGGPGDGGKDVCKNIPLLGDYHTQIWAQCKFYHHTLSFDDVSFTLLMAYLKNTNQVLIFSYSKVSDTFLENLNEYIARTAKDVILYADEELEALILKHQKKLLREHKEFFNDFPKDCYFENEPFRTDYQIYIDGRRITGSETVVNINSICELVITITNKTLIEKTITLMCVKKRYANIFIFLDEDVDKTYNIQANHSTAFKFYIRLKRSISKVHLPVFKLLFDKTSIEIHTNKTLNCRWLADTPLIGNRYYAALDKINAGIQCPHFHLIYIFGKSGIGKSRLLKEAQTQCVKSGKRMIYIDSEKKDLPCKRFIELLSSRMTLLPIFNERITFLSDTGEMTIEYATRILYDDTFDITLEWEKTAKFLAFLLESEKFVLALDNLQHFDKLSLQIINNLTTFLKHSNCESTILLGINTDYIYKNSAFEEFFYQLKYSGGNAPQFYTEIPIEGFEPCDTELYIRECLTYHPGDTTVSKIDYEKAIAKIAEHCGNNPFYIQQYLLYLHQKGILTRSRNTLYYFCDVQKFLESFFEIPISIESLIRERERLLLNYETGDFEDCYRKTIYLLNLTKSLPETIYYDIIGNHTLLETLLDMGFLSMMDGAIVPIHNYYTIYYGSKYALDSVPRELMEQFIKTVDSKNCREELALPYFWAKFHVGSVDFSDLQFVSTQINAWNFDCAAFRFCLNAVCVTAEKYIKELDVDEYLEIYRNLCKKVDEALGIRESIRYYEKFLTSFLKNSNLYTNRVDAASSLIYEGLIHLVNLERYEDCMNAIDHLLEKAVLFHDKDWLKLVYRVNSCKIMIYNRNDEVPDAITSAKENLLILQTDNLDPDFSERLSYSAKRSIGNTYFYSTVAYEKRQEIIDSWTDSFLSFVKHYGMNTTEGFSNQPKVAAFAKGLAADMIAEREVQAEEKIVFLGNAFDRMHMMYYEMQIRLLMAIYLTWKWSDRATYYGVLEEINRYIDQTLDIAAIYGRQLTTINAFHMRAVVYSLARNYELAFDNYCIAAELLTKYLKTEKDFARWEYFWVDFARAWRKYDNEAVVDAIKYCDVHTTATIRRIRLMEDCAFSRYEESYVPMTALTDKNHWINFPKL